jgi:dTDP-4-amino-4,6-dideoxygalactose transaminase
VSERLASELFCLPVHPGVTDEQVEQIAGAAAKVAGALAR